MGGVAATPASSPADGPAPGSDARRQEPGERGRAGRHHLALAVVLFALLPVAGSNAVWSADEGALLYQIDALASGRGWTFDHPLPDADPSGTYFPIHLSSWASAGETGVGGVGGVDGGGGEAIGRCRAAADGSRTDCRYIVLAKHTWFLWLATGLYRIGGYGAIIAFSVVAGLAAATATSRLAAMIEPAARIPALWIAGIGSPLFVGAYVAWAHTLGAALIGWAAVCLLDQPGRVRWRAAGLLLLVAAALVRTEAPLAGFAIGIGLMVAAVIGPTGGGRRGVRLLTGISAMVATATGVVLDRATDINTGGPVEPVGFDAAFGFVQGRLEAFAITWLQPAYGSDPRDLLLVAAATLTLASGVLARRGHRATGRVTVGLVLAVVALLGRLALGPAALVPGLVIAFPLLFVGLLLIDRRSLLDGGLVVLVAPFVLFCGAVLATQYRQGGGGEWGGRYFAVGLPLGIAAAAVALVRAGARLPDRDRRRLAGLATASMVLLSGMGMAGLRAVRDQTESLADEVGAALDRFDGDDDRETGGRSAGESVGSGIGPVVVTTVPGAGRWLWQDVDRGHWLRIPPADLELVGARLHDLGVGRLVVVSTDREQLAQLEPWFGIDATDLAAGSPPTGDPASESKSASESDDRSASPLSVATLSANR